MSMKNIRIPNFLVESRICLMLRVDMKKIKILLVDDDVYFRLAVKDVIREFGIITEAQSAQEAIELLKNEYFDLALIDMQMKTDHCGLEVLKYTAQKSIHSIILSSYNNDETTTQCYENGCQHFLAKIHYSKSLKSYITNFVRSKSSDSIEYITNNEKLLNDLNKLKSINLSDQCVFISGETGVGKSLIGKAIHKFNNLKEDNFVHLNCSEISENLIESELFGHVKGSFTGANSNKKGLLEIANGGTLFLDEIATMPMAMQQKLLKALDEKSFYPVGSDKLIRTSFTLITATCEDLFQKITNKEFRKDLFFRISGFNIDIAPLRERKEDITDLARFFVSKMPRRIVLKESAVCALNEYSWPGNIRELKKIINLLGQEKKGLITDVEVNALVNSSELDSNENSWLTQNQKEYISGNGLRAFMKKIEEEIVSEMLSKHQGKITHAIKDLKISSSAFYRIFENLKA